MAEETNIAREGNVNWTSVSRERRGGGVSQSGGGGAGGEACIGGKGGGGEGEGSVYKEGKE